MCFSSQTLKPDCGPGWKRCLCKRQNNKTPESSSPRDKPTDRPVERSSWCWYRCEVCSGKKHARNWSFSHPGHHAGLSFVGQPSVFDIFQLVVHIGLYHGIDTLCSTTYTKEPQKESTGKLRRIALARSGWLRLIGLTACFSMRGIAKFKSRLKTRLPARLLDACVGSPLLIGTGDS